MSNIDMKKKIVQQANNTSTPQQTQSVNPVKTNQSTITTPAINNSQINNTPKPVGSPGSLTGSNTNINPNARTMTNNPVAQNNSLNMTRSSSNELKKPGNVIDQIKPIFDEQNKLDKDYLDKWQQTQNDRLDSEYKDALAQLESSKNGVEQNFNKGKEEIADTLYKQQEQLNVDGTMRGISNSPQILGLQGVHNINYRKNLTSLIENKNNLLNEIDLKINSLKTDYTNNKNDIALGLLDKKTSLSGKYNQQLIELMLKQYDQDYNRWQTEEDRKYQESQKDDDRKWEQSQIKEEREWQKEWYKYQLEMEKQYAKSGRSSYSSNYSPSYSYGGRKNYSSGWTPYNWSDWSGGGSNVDTSDVMVANAGMDEALKGSSDVFNALNNRSSLTTLNNYDEKEAIYNAITDEYANGLKSLPSEYQKNYEDTRRIARKKMLDRAYGNSTNTPYLKYDKRLGKDVLVRPSIPWNDKTIDKNKQKGNVMKAHQKYGKTGERIANNANTVHNNIIKKAKVKKSTDTLIKKSNQKKVDKKTEKKPNKKLFGANKKQQKEMNKKAIENAKKRQAEAKKKANEQRRKKEIEKKKKQQQRKSKTNSFIKKIFGKN